MQRRRYQNCRNCRPERDGRLDPIAERVDVVFQNSPPLRSPQDLTKHCGGKTWNLYKDGKAQEVRLRRRVSVGELMVHHQLCRAGVAEKSLPR
jgi:hypothetical protein